MLAPPTCPDRRRGMASLELVIGLPFLVFIVALIFSMGRGALRKFEALELARNQAFALKVATAPNPLRLDGSESDGLTSSSVNQPFSMAPFRPDPPLVVSASAAVLRGTWDHDAVGFGEPEPIGVSPLPSVHFKEIRMIASNPEIALGPALGEFTSLMSTVSGETRDLSSLLQAGGSSSAGISLTDFDPTGALQKLKDASQAKGSARTADVTGALMDIGRGPGTGSLSSFMEGFDPTQYEKLARDIPKIISQLDMVGDYFESFVLLPEALFNPPTRWEPFDPDLSQPSPPYPGS
jgi:hypothetical protein